MSPADPARTLSIPATGSSPERELFARAVEEAGIIFVGPHPWTIAAMGDKTEARRRMAEAGVTIVPGLTERLEDAAAAEREALEIGLPTAN